MTNKSRNERGTRERQTAQAAAVSSIVFLQLLAVTSATGWDFRSPEEPGFRLTSQNAGKHEAPEHALLNCVMPGLLDLAYVEACAIFKHENERVLECRHDEEALERHPLTVRSEEEEQILITCSDQALSKAK